MSRHTVVRLTWRDHFVEAVNVAWILLGAGLALLFGLAVALVLPVYNWMRGRRRTEADARAIVDLYDHPGEEV